ncbi:transposase [Pseudomonas carnis]|uniref:transposase n=1 Tax=Pseudomonas carnis TaxID=2487355 RepID=UPI0035B47C24
MTKQRRSFSAEFKREAADLVLKQNYSYIEASRSLGVGESALRRWVDQVGEPAEFGKNRTLSRAMCLRASALKRMVPRTSEKRAKAQRHRRP